MTIEAILKNTRSDTYTRTANECKDAKINESALLVGDGKNIKIKSCNSNKSDRNIGNYHEENHLKSSKLNNRKSQTESCTYSNGFAVPESSKNKPKRRPKNQITRRNHKSNTKNSNFPFDPKSKLKNTQLKNNDKQDAREICRTVTRLRSATHNALKARKPKSELIKPEIFVKMWEEVKNFNPNGYFNYSEIFAFRNRQEAYLKDLSPSEVIEILDEMAGSDAEKRKKISDLKEKFASLIQNGYEKLKNLRKEKGEFESRIFDLLKECGSEHTQEITVQTAILAEAVAVFLRDTFTEFAELNDDDIADTIIAAFLYKSKGDWLNGAEICRSSENYVKKILASVSPDLGEQRCTRIINAIDHKNDPLFDSDGLIKKDLLAIILQITSRINCNEINIRSFDLTGKNYKIDNPSFNFSSSLPSEEIHTKMMAFLDKAFQFIKINIQDLAEEVLGDLETHPNYKCPLGRSLYEIYRNGPAIDTHLFKMDRPYFRYNSQPCDAPYRGKMENVTPKQIFKFLSGKKLKVRIKFSAKMIKLLKNKDRSSEENKKLENMGKELPMFTGEKFSELFKYENVFEIAETFLKLPKKNIIKLLVRKGFNSCDFKHILSIASSCLELKKNGWSEKFAQRVTFYRVRLLEDKVFMKGHRGGRGAYKEASDHTMREPGSKAVLQYSKIKIFDQVTITHTRHCVHKFAKFVSSHGGIYSIIELLIGSQDISSWCAIPVLVKEWLLQQRKDPNASWGAYLNEKSSTVNPESVFFHFTDGNLIGKKEDVEKCLRAISYKKEPFWNKLLTQDLASKKDEKRTCYEQDLIRRSDESLKTVLKSNTTEIYTAKLESIRNDLDKVHSSFQQQIERQTNSSTDLFTDEFYVELKNKIDPALTEIMENIEQAMKLSQESSKNNKLLEIFQKLSNLRKKFDVMVPKMFDDVGVYRGSDVNLTNQLKLEVDKENMTDESDVCAFDETLYMFYAFTQGTLYLVPDFPKEFYRACDDKTLENYFGLPNEKITENFTQKLKNTATYDPYSTGQLSEFGHNMIKISADPWRIFMPIPLFTNLIPEFQVDFSEFDIMAGGCDATVIKRQRDDSSYSEGSDIEVQ